MSDEMIESMGIRLIARNIGASMSVGVHEVYFNAAGDPVMWNDSPVTVCMEYDEYFESCTGELRDYVEGIENAFSMEAYVVRFDENGDEFLDII